jgi:hypothetical protein
MESNRKMTATRLRIFILGFTAIVIPAKASLSFETSQSAFTNQATTIDGLVVSSLFTFTGTLTEFGSVANDEYIDGTTGVEFIAFKGNGSGTGITNEPFTLSGSNLNTRLSQGDAIEVILPAATYGLAINFTSSVQVTYCMDLSSATFSTCDGSAFILAGASGFLGTLSDNPTLATLTTIWLHPASSGSPAVDLQSFQIATEASVPDAATMLTLGSGLILIALQLRRRKSRSLTGIHGR